MAISALATLSISDNDPAPFLASITWPAQSSPFVRVTDMNVGNLSYLAHPESRKQLRWKLLVLLALICIPLLATGCFCLNVGGCGCDHAEPNGVLAQKGKLNGTNGDPITIYY